VLKEGTATHRKKDHSADKRSQNASMRAVQHFGEAFAAIQQATGIKDNDQLVERFMEAEDANFSLFNYVQQVHAEVEKLEEQIGSIKAEIETYQSQDASHETERRKNLQELQQRKAEMQQSAALYQHKHEMAVKRVHQLAEGIQQMYDQAGCDTPQVRELLGEGKVTDSTIMPYLGVIEQRANELVQDYVMAMVRDDGAAAEKAAQIMISPAAAPAGIGSRFVIEPPSTIVPVDSDDDSGDDAEELRPLDRQALEKKVQRSLSKRGDVPKVKPASANKAAPSPTKQR
jgi:regulator of replication initiation timing